MTTAPRTMNLPTPRPFLKWVGGKGQLLDKLNRHINLLDHFGRYHEPFVGGGALFFELYRTQRLGRKKAFLSDNNRRLIEVYQGLQQDVEGVIDLLKKHQAAHGHDYYYQVRATTPPELTARAARIIYLNKTCFNGLFRENSKGKFNVPMGRYKNPLICDEKNLRAVATALNRAKLAVRPFESILDTAQAGDLVYFDPPYHPVSKTASFTAYNKHAFGPEDQQRLADTARELTRKNVYVLLSNSWTPFIRELYADFNTNGGKVESVLATRNVNSRADKRGAVKEALIRNF